MFGIDAARRIFFAAVLSMELAIGFAYASVKAPSVPVLLKP
jgi:hypothetical protein